MNSSQNNIPNQSAIGRCVAVTNGYDLQLKTIFIPNDMVAIEDFFCSLPIKSPTGEQTQVGRQEGRTHKLHLRLHLQMQPQTQSRAHSKHCSLVRSSILLIITEATRVAASIKWAECVSFLCYVVL